MTATAELFAAIDNRDIAATQQALDNGADIHARNDDGQTVLHAFVKYEKRAGESLLQLLVDAGADVNAKNTAGQTPMDYALNAPHTVRYGQVLHPETGEPVGEKRPDETQYGPSASDVTALFKQNAKASNHAEAISEIRKAMCTSSAFLSKQSIERVLSKISQTLAESKDAKSVPPLDAPAYEQNIDDPICAFAKCLEHVNLIASALGGQTAEQATYNLIGNLRESSWEEYAAKLPEDSFNTYYSVRDMRVEFCKQLVGSALLRGLDDDSLAKVENQHLNSLIPLPIDYTIPQMMSENRNPEQIIEMADSYHRNVTALHDKLNLRIDELEWQPLLLGGSVLHPQLDGLEGWTIEHLTTGRELKEEGIRMSHCVAGYASACMMGKSHIFSVRNAEGESVSTFEIATGKPFENMPYAVKPVTMPNGTQYTLNQHYASGNTATSAESNQVMDWFLDQVKSGEAALQTDEKKIGATPENAAWNKTSVLEQVLFHYKADMTAERQQYLYDAMVGNADDAPRIRSGRRNYLVAPSLRKMPVEDMLEETGLNKAITNMCEMFKLKYTPPQKEQAQTPNWQSRLAQNNQSQDLGRS